MRRFSCWLLFFLFMAPWAPCSAASAADAPARIISLAPNITEILFALGLGDRIAGVTNFCDYPEEAKRKPKIGGMSNPSLEAVVVLRPDVVVLTTDGNPKEFEEKLRSMNIRTYVFTARRLSELPQGIRELGSALGVKEKADHLAASIRSSLDSYGRSHTAAKGKKALFIVWPEPLIAAGAGTVIDDSLTLLGVENLAARTGIAYPKYSIEEILRHPPDVIIIGRGMDSKNVENISRGLLHRLKILPAVREGRVYYVGDGLFRLGPRTLQGIAELIGVMGRTP